MKTSIKNLPESQIELKIEIPNVDFERFIKKATKELGKNLEIKGFRKGQAPEEIIQEKLGIEKILPQAAEDAVREKYFQIIEEKNLEPITQPKVEILKLAKGNPFEFKLTITVLPEIKLPDYKKLAAQTKKKKVSVSEEEVEDALNWLQKSKAKFTVLDKPAGKGDFVEIEYKSPQINASKPMKDGFVLGKGYFIPGFEEKLEALNLKTKEKMTEQEKESGIVDRTESVIDDAESGTVNSEENFSNDETI